MGSIANRQGTRRGVLQEETEIQRMNGVNDLLLQVKQLIRCKWVLQTKPADEVRTDECEDDTAEAERGHCGCGDSRDNLPQPAEELTQAAALCSAGVPVWVQWPRATRQSRGAARFKVHSALPVGAAQWPNVGVRTTAAWIRVPPVSGY